ncbi:MAG: iron-sulfur cluster assembly scaffold protein [Promethearchaeota archaeon]
MQFFLKINDNKIEKANFITDGCGATVAAGSQTTLMIEGKALDFAETLSPEDIDKALKRLSNDHKHCAELVIRTLKRAIEKYKYNKS